MQIRLARAPGFWQDFDMTARNLILVALMLLIAGPIDAAPRLGAAEFEATVTGRTYSYEAEGKPYGTERYLPGRRVIWAFDGAECREGSWDEVQPGLICFTYDDNQTERHCWAFSPAPDQGLSAEFLGTGQGSDIQPGNSFPILARPTQKPMICPGPDVGV